MPEVVAPECQRLVKSFVLRSRLSPWLALVRGDELASGLDATSRPLSAARVAHSVRLLPDWVFNLLGFVRPVRRTGRLPETQAYRGRCAGLLRRQDAGDAGDRVP